MPDSLFDDPEPLAQAAPQADARGSSSTGTWSEWLQQPSNQAMLITMGAQLMQPSWHGPLANLGQAVASGVEAQSATTSAQQTRDLQRQQANRSSANQAADRATRVRVAEIGAEGRFDVAQLRTGAMLERARMIGARSTGSASAFQQMTQRYFQQLSRDNPIAGTGRKTADELHEQAMQLAERAMRQQGLLDTAQQPPSQQPPNSGPPPAPSSSPTSSVSPTTPTVTGAPSTTATMSWEQFLQRPQARSLLSNERARQELLRIRPDWAQQIQQYR